VRTGVIRWEFVIMKGKIGESEAQPIVFIIDDDELLRDALSGLIRSVGLEVRTFGAVSEFMSTPRPDVPACLVLDVRLPGVSGLDFQSQLAQSSEGLPVIMMTGHGDVPMTVRAMKAGAVDFITKPFRDQDMLDAIGDAIRRDTDRRATAQAESGLRVRYGTLSPREQQVMKLVVTGLMNKQVAGELELSEITVKIHRGNAMRKMGARSLAELVRMADALQIGPASGKTSV
jgi:FixJ family two-component response regulator